MIILEAHVYLLPLIDLILTKQTLIGTLIGGLTGNLLIYFVVGARI